MKRPVFTLTFITIHAGAACFAASYDEAVDGDLSDDRLAPTSLSLDSGDNRVMASTMSDDLEYLTITVAQPFSLTAIMLESYVSTDLIAFAAVQEGTIFTESFEGVNPANILGLTHFGLEQQPTVANVGEDLLDNMGAGTFGGMGFEQPLPAGDHTFWLQQIGQATTTYTLNFMVSMGQTQTIRGDMDDNGVLDAFDVDDFEWALAGTSTAVPEPDSLILLFVFADAVSRRRFSRDRPLASS